MRKIASLSLILFYLILGTHVAFGEVLRKLPLSDTIDWNDLSKRRSYEEILRNAGIMIEVIKITETDWIAAKSCFLLKNNGMTIGYGALFTKFRVFGYAENKKTGHGIKIDIRRVEIIFDNEERYVFLTTHRFRLSLLERLFALSQSKKHNVERGLYSGPDLGDGYFLDQPTQELVTSLLTEVSKCSLPSQ